MIPALRAFGRTLCRNHTDADDLVQETLTKGLANMHRFEPGTNLKSWLFTIMRNSFYTNMKLRNREQPGAADCVAGNCTVAASQEWSVRAKELRAALEKLPGDQREVLILIGVLGVSYEDAAVICGVAVGTIKSRLSRARVRILELLDPPEQEEAHPPMQPAFRPIPLPSRLERKYQPGYFHSAGSLRSLSDFLGHGTHMG
ncbi:sigma-70 family RNA polymerase sigma factor [Oceanibaculum pacificum]|uniref:sigma-70 family RNA polymerase sigma factor n=1 Tax=Oceanibaculum pacificum TaxID=580166 RepID=UPI001E61194B|nr:sigma-70 family RNA polymerase sigma factor [Oceanibaculum pacificum]